MYSSAFSGDSWREGGGERDGGRKEWRDEGRKKGGGEGGTEGGGRKREEVLC